MSLDLLKDFCESSAKVVSESCSPVLWAFGIVATSLMTGCATHDVSRVVKAVATQSTLPLRRELATEAKQGLRLKRCGSVTTGTVDIQSGQPSCGNENPFGVPPRPTR